jgi:hypothetical protein
MWLDDDEDAPRGDETDGDETDGDDVHIPGPCCACMREDSPARGPLRNLVTLAVRTPVDGTGWGCLVCSLPSNGAVAACCDDCIAGGAPILHACRGYPTSGERVPVADLFEGWHHDLRRHEEEEEP